MHSAFLVAIAVAAAVVVGVKLNARRRYARMKVSGGRKSLFLNIFERS